MRQTPSQDEQRRGFQGLPGCWALLVLGSTLVLAFEVPLPPPVYSGFLLDLLAALAASSGASRCPPGVGGVRGCGGGSSCTGSPVAGSRWVESLRRPTWLP